MRTIIKHSYIKTARSAVGRARAHLRYLQFRPGKDIDSRPHRQFFNERDSVDYREVQKLIDDESRSGVLIHKLILSPGVEGADLREFTREVMSEIAKRRGRSPIWWAVEHDNTDNPHCHVIVMGYDKDGRRMRFDKDDYFVARAAGDECLEKAGHLERWREKNLNRERNSESQKIFDKVVRLARAAGKDLLAKLNAHNEASRETVRFSYLEQQEREQRLLGDAPSREELAERQLSWAQRDAELQAADWKKYCVPIVIAYTQEDIDEKVVYTWKSSLKALRELEREYLDGDPYVRRSMSAQDYDKLVRWIKDSWKERRDTNEKADSIKRIEVDYSDGSTKVIDRNSSIEDLQDLQRHHVLGSVNLMDDELLALRRWATHARVRRGDRAGTNYYQEQLGYDLSRSEDAAKMFLDAKEQGAEWASVPLTDVDYKKLISKVDGKSAATDAAKPRQHEPQRDDRRGKRILLDRWREKF